VNEIFECVDLFVTHLFADQLLIIIVVNIILKKHLEGTNDTHL
jgi:hypothetical protein